MSAKRKISVRKILQLVVTVIVTAGCIAAVSSASRKHEVKKISGIEINIRNDRYQFVDKEEVKRMLLGNRHIDLQNTKVSKLNVHQMEKIISANPWVEDAQVYVDNRKVLHVNLTQRIPVARLFEQNGNSYYVDARLNTMPLSSKYTYYTTVVTNVPVLKDDSTSKALRGEIAYLVKHVERDSFWRAQVSQIVVTDDRTYELVPVLGNHRIIVGDTGRIDEKLHNLFSFYKKILNRIGWDKYEVLDVRFAGQVVASPSLPWKKPADGTMSNMNWVKTLIEADANKGAEPDTPQYTVANKAAVAKVEVKAPVQSIQKPEPPKQEHKEAAKPAANTVAKAKPAAKKQIVADAKKPTVKKNVVTAKVENKKSKSNTN
jgi:cell division protein FtsQ